MAYDENHRPSILLITDGCDTNHATKIITVGIDDDGNPLTRDLRDTAAIEASGQTYQEARAEAVLMFLTNVIKAHTFVVGIGNMCSDILNVAKRLPIVAARLHGDSTPAQAYAVMRKTLNTAPPARGTTTPTIELTSLAADEAPEALTDPADAALIAAAAANYRKITYGAVLTAEELYDSWLAAGAAAPNDATAAPWTTTRTWPTRAARSCSSSARPTRPATNLQAPGSTPNTTPCSIRPTMCRRRRTRRTSTSCCTS